MNIVMRCDGKINPICTAKIPEFSWLCEEFENCGNYQLSYRITVYDINHNVYWDSGRIESSDSAAIAYEGKVLPGHTKLYWNVLLETEKGYFQSEEAFFVTGLFETDWHAKWITGDFQRAPIFQKKVTLSEITDSYAFICGLGYFELYINNKRVGEDYFVPNHTDYEKVTYRDLPFPYDGETAKRIHYLGYDVTEYLKEGDNIIEIWLGNGWYKQDTRCKIEGYFEYDDLKMIFQLNSDKYEVVSDEDWLVADGPIVSNDLFSGEIYDANIHYDKSFNPVRLANVPESEFSPQLAPTDKIMEVITPTLIEENLYDNGKNITGFVGFVCKGKKGGKITVRYAECVDEKNKLDFTSTVGYTEHDNNQIQKDVYILSGEDEEFYRPHFVWHGFRYFDIELENAEIIDLKTYYIYTSVINTNKFESSDELLNSIHNMYVNSEKMALHGAVPADCPHRERLGYTGDGQGSSYSTMFNFDCRNFYKKWIEDILGAQNKETGYVPHTAPFRGGAGGPGWGSAIAIIPWNYYLHYGDKKLLKKCLPQIEKWITYLTGRRNSKGLVCGDDDFGWCLGDWCLPLGKDIEWSNPRHDLISLPSELVNTCFYIQCISLYQKMMHILGEERYDFSAEKQEAKLSVNREYLKTHYASGTQGSDVFPLYVDIVPDDFKEHVLESLKKNIENNDFTFDTGIFGTGYMLSVLAKNKLNDYAYKLLSQTNYPSYGNMVKNGATSVWETWEGTGSQAHGGLGCFDFWLYQELAGIHPTDKGGFKEFKISPYFADEIDYVNAEYLTNHGYLKVNWKRSENKILLYITVPFNTTAYIDVNDKQIELSCGNYEFKCDF